MTECLLTERYLQIHKDTHTVKLCVHTRQHPYIQTQNTI